jgi:hypothetical protein
MIKELQEKLDKLNTKRQESGLSGREECTALDLVDRIRELKQESIKIKESEFRLVGG